MKRFAALATVVGLAFGVSEILAQPSLDRLEGQLPPRGPAPAPATAASQPRGYLGAELDDEEAAKGVRVKHVRPGTPAQAGGLVANDLITSINGKPVANLDAYDEVAVGPPGTRLQIMVDRGGRPQSVTVTLGTRPAAPPPAAGSTAPTPGTVPGASEPQLGAPSLSPPNAASPGSRSSVSPLPSDPAGAAGGTTLLPGGSPSLAPPVAGDSSRGSTLPIPAVPGSTQGGAIRAQPLELGPPPASVPDDIPPAAPSDLAVPSGGSPSIGVSVVTFTEQTRVQSGVPVRRGALIANVKSGSPAAQAGLPEGGVIVRFNDRPIGSDNDLINAVKASRPGQEVEISYYEGSRLSRKQLRVGSAGAASGGPGLASSAPSLPPPPASGPGPIGGGGTMGPGASGRPFMQRLERMTENLSRPPPISTVWDPHAMADLQKQVVELTNTVKALEERLRSLESRSGGAGGASSPTPVPAAGPGLSGPSLGPITNP